MALQLDLGPPALPASEPRVVLGNCTAINPPASNLRTYALARWVIELVRIGATV
jgi:hypothetical protein